MTEDDREDPRTDEKPIITAEVTTLLSFTTGTTLFGFSVITDRKLAQRGLTKGRRLGPIVEQTLPALLRGVADLCEQQGGTFEDLAQVLDDAHRRNER